ncbi:MAG TPA: choice-of-anchor P family protein [Jatrophihabitans sp.]|jgi:ribosomal protein S9|nr:choice-of-anchor P family protein [Jatrophihabitans sp.]
MKINGTALTATAVVGVTAAAIAVGATGVGATTGYSFVGWAGGSLVRAANNTVTSDLTAASSINYEDPATDTNTAAALHIPDLLNAGAVKTSTSSTAIAHGYKVVSTAETANISALGGLIKADAIKTTSTATVVNGVASASVASTFVHLKVGSVNVPINVKPNTIIRIPNIATVALNYQLDFAKGNSSYNIGIGAYVSLLKPRGDNAIGAELSLSPTYAALGPVTVPPSGHFLYAKAFGTQVTAKVGSLAGVQSDPTAPITMAAAGTHGQTQTSSIAGVNLNPAARVGGVTDSIFGTNTQLAYNALATSKIASINLFRGLITADAITASAQAKGLATALRPTLRGSSQLVNLRINGKSIPINASPNTTITVLHLLKVTINQQIKTTKSVTVRGLDIKLSTAAYGLPAGAEVQVAVATASAT